EDDHQVGVGLGCQGIIDVLFTPLDPDDPRNPVQILSTLIHIRRPVCLVTVTGGPRLGHTFIFKEETFSRDLSFPDPLPDIYDGLSILQSRTIAYGNGVTLFIEIVLPSIQVMVYGNNNDIYPFLRMSVELGWDTTLVTHLLRADKALSSLAGRVIDQSEEEISPVDAYTAIVLMTHDYRTDLRRLPQALATAASYIGILGPRKRTERMYAALAAEGRPVSEPDRRRIYSPAGLDIGATTPEEIALSILAEIRGHFAGRQGASLRLRTGAIYSGK
ncbi:MAG TPA: XdhC family protein, partial [Puia sp.]|nr:XdhC family protein [Puia sp.]